MENHEDYSVIKQVAVGKNSDLFLPDEEQKEINKKLYKKLAVLLREFRQDKIRPKSMLLVDKMFDDTHSVFIKALKERREKGGHVISLFCHAVPPEVFYAAPDTFPVNTCMGASELEVHATDQMQDSCSLSRSLTGFLNSGMCVFMNVADYAININACHSFKRLPNAVSPKVTLNIKNIEKDEEVRSSELLTALKEISSGELDRDRFLKYSQMYLKIRSLYKDISSFRKAANPPVSGKDIMWMQQMYLASSPETLLPTLEKIKAELAEKLKNNIGNDPSGEKKRVLLISPRHMPPFAQIYRLIENSGGVIVREYMCTGIEIGDYDFSTVKSLVKSEGITDNVIDITMQKANTTALACETNFDKEQLEADLKAYSIDKVIVVAFKKCLSMLVKNNKIQKLLESKNVDCLNFDASYDESYINEGSLKNQIKNFLQRE